MERTSFCSKLLAAAGLDACLVKQRRFRVIQAPFLTAREAVR